MLNIKKLLLLACGTILTAVDPGHAQTLVGEEYQNIGYSGAATDNRVARLAARMENDEIQLQYRGYRGYLDSFLEALEIDPSSQILVFSPTSLQYQWISSTHPRALYFNDDTYVGWVQGSEIIEVAVTDAKLGLVFYIFSNTPNVSQPLNKTTQQCLVCHDTYGMMGGGVPLLLARSSLYNYKGEKLQDITGQKNVGDQTPLAERWGGWYVTGRHGDQTHLGNIVLNNPAELRRIDDKMLGNLETLAGMGFLDTEPYLQPTSDIVALLVLEHQLTVQNQITYVKFKAPVVLERMGMSQAFTSPSWATMPPKAQRVLSRMLNNLVATILFADAAPFADKITGSPEYQSWFLQQGPRDKQGRSLREFDLETRLFKYPLSYLVYSRDFDTLPAFAKDYIYQQLAAILEGRSEDETSASLSEQLSEQSRRAIREILTATKKDFVPYLSEDY